MNSKRLECIIKYINKEDIVLDVGCDHGYLSIYLAKEKLCKKVYASDISENALNQARKNILKENLQIDTYVSDGFNNIPVKFNTAVITGMGTSTILKILDSKKRPSKLILGSQNELYKLRLELNKLGFMIKDEEVIYEKGHYYVILHYILGKEKLSKSELKFGKSNNIEYYKYLLDKNKTLLKKVPFKKRLSLYEENYMLKRLIQKM